MFVVNFDFSDHFLPFKLLAINAPIFVTELFTYPLQRLQTLLVATQHYLTSSQLTEAQLILRSMVGVEKFPKFLHGMRYSVDYTATQMTAKFLIFDFLIEKTKQIQTEKTKWMIFFNCYMASLFSTLASQIAFNYQTIASSLPIDKNNRTENVTIKLQKYTMAKNKMPFDGIKFSIPVALINTTIEISLIYYISGYLQQISQLNANSSYILSDFLTAFCILTSTSFASHYALQRQVEICNGLKAKSIKYSKGLLGTLIRQNVKGLTLFGMYVWYFEWKARKSIESSFAKRDPRGRPQSYRM